MKFTHLLAACMLLGLMIPPSFAQTPDLSLFPTQKIDPFRYFSYYKKTPSGTIFRIGEIPSSWSGLRSRSRIIQKLDSDLNVVAEYEVDINEAGGIADFLAILCHDDFITILTVTRDSEAQEIVYMRLLLNSDDLSVSSPFSEIFRIQDRYFDYTAGSDISLDQDLVSLVYKKENQNDSSTYYGIVFSKEMEVIYQGEDIYPNNIFSSDQRKIFSSSYDRDSMVSSIYSYDLITGESQVLISDEPYYWQRCKLFNQGPYFYMTERIKGEGGKFGLFDPETMDHPIIASFSEEDEIWFLPRKMKEPLWSPLSMRVLDVFRTEEENWIITLNFFGIDSYDFKLIGGNLTTFAINADGELQWINCIPRHQDIHPGDRMSARVFRDSAGIHFIYNEGENNLTLSSEDEPKIFNRPGSGSAIIAHGYISNQGEVTREKLYDLQPDRMWLDVSETRRVSDDLFVIRLYGRKKEKLGFLRITD